MKKFLSIQQLMGETNQTIGRFPLPMLLATMATVIGFFLIEVSHKDQELVTTLMQWAMTIAFGGPILTGLALAGERGKWKKGAKALANVGGLLLMLGYYQWIIPGGETMFWYGSQVATIVMLNASAYLTLTFAPFWRVSENQGFWQYNRHLVTRLFLTGLTVGVLTIGSSLILFTIKELFNLDLSDKLYMHIQVLIMGIVAPLVFFAGIPKELGKLEKEKTIPKVVKAFGQYVLIPLISVYIVILYVYAGQILITTEWPKGIIAGLIIGYASIGILSMLILHPFQREKGNEWIRRYAKWFYILLLPLVVMLFVAIGIRIANYGITEIRYYGILLGVWLAGMALYNTISKKIDIKRIPLSVSVLMLLSLWGPWSSFQISQNSQTNRLTELLVRHEMLQNDRLVKKASEVIDLTEDEKENMQSIVEYLGNRHDFASIKQWFQNEIPDYATLEPWTLNEEVFAFMGLSPYNENIGFRYYDVLNQNTRTTRITGYDEFVQIWRNGFPEEKSSTLTLNSGEGKLRIDKIENKVIVKKDEEIPLELDMESLLKALEEAEKQSGTAPSNKMVINAENETMSVMLSFANIAFQTKKDAYTVESFNAYLFIGYKN